MCVKSEEGEEDRAEVDRGRHRQPEKDRLRHTERGPDRSMTIQDSTGTRCSGAVGGC